MCRLARSITATTNAAHLSWCKGLPVPPESWFGDTAKRSCLGQVGEFEMQESRQGHRGEENVWPAVARCDVHPSTLGVPEMAASTPTSPCPARQGGGSSSGSSSVELQGRASDPAPAHPTLSAPWLSELRHTNPAPAAADSLCETEALLFLSLPFQRSLCVLGTPDLLAFPT